MAERVQLKLMQQPLTAVKIGNTRTLDTADWSSRGSRTQNQYEAVLAHFRRHPAAWMTGNPFAFGPGGRSYRCAFSMSYFDIEGRYCTIIVTPGGRVDYFRSDASTFKEDTDAVVERYGAFRG